jgi:hypothetical protein
MRLLSMTVMRGGVAIMIIIIIIITTKVMDTQLPPGGTGKPWLALQSWRGAAVQAVQGNTRGHFCHGWHMAMLLSQGRWLGANDVLNDETLCSLPW